MTLTEIADELYTELGAPDDISLPSVEFWLSSNYAKVNNLLATDFELINLELSPEMADNEKSILKCLYFINYFQRQVSKNLGAAAYTTVAEVTEGNRTVRRANKNEVAKTYLALVKMYQDQLVQEVISYKMNGAGVTQFIITNPVAAIAAYQNVALLPLGVRS